VYALGRILADLIDDAGGAPPRPLRSIVGRATAAAPADRYADAASLGADVRRFADGQAVHAHRETGVERIVRFTRTYRTPIALVLTYLVVRLLLLLWTG
jgi:hypothetical protein